MRPWIVYQHVGYPSLPLVTLVPLANFYSSNVVAWVKTLETTNRLRRTDYVLDHCDGLRPNKQ